MLCWVFVFWLNAGVSLCCCYFVLCVGFVVLCCFVLLVFVACDCVCFVWIGLVFDWYFFVCVLLIMVFDFV